MKAIADLLPPVLWALAVAAHTYAILKHGIQKETLPMSEPLNEAGAGGAAEPAPAPPPVPQLTTAQSAVVTGLTAVNPIVAAIISGVHSTTSDPTQAAVTVASVLQAAAPVISTAETIGRASPQTQTWVAIGEMAAETLASVVSLFFPHPAAKAA